jgi:hypothetical protein
MGTTLSGAAAGQVTAGVGEVLIERPVPGKPHAGKVLVAIQPHADDIPLFAAGTVAKLIQEGYTGYLIRMTNDDMAGPGGVGETVLANERDNQEVARVLGLRRVFDLMLRSNRTGRAGSRAEVTLRRRAGAPARFAGRLESGPGKTGARVWAESTRTGDAAATSLARAT